MTFTDNLIESRDDLWQTILNHPFLDDIRNDELDDEQFNQWLRQDYEFVKSALPFVSALKPKAPDEHLRPLAEAEVALHDELDLFRERADALDVDVGNVDLNLANHAYIQFLIATGYRENFAAGLTVYWTAEKAYHESWKVVESALPSSHPWYPFVENWAGEDFGEFVQYLETTVNELAGDVSPKEKDHMRELFTWTVRYEIAFWDMAYGESGSEWIRPSGHPIERGYS